MIRIPRITQAFPVDRRTLIKSAGFAAAGFAAFPLAGCKAQDASMLDSTPGSNPLAIPPLQRGEIEQGRLISVVYVDTRGRDLTSVVSDLQAAVSVGVDLPAGVSISYAGQFEYLTRANERLQVVVPATLGIIFVLLYLIFRRFDEALLVMGTLPFALTGGFWLLYLMGYNQSVATSVGFIALAGVSAEFGVIMLIYLKSALARRSGALDADGVGEAIREGALLRVRPKAMTVAVILAGLFPILIGTGAGSEVMSRIAAPMVGGMITAPLLSMFVIPAAYLLMRRPRPERPTQPQGEEECVPQPS